MRQIFAIAVVAFSAAAIASGQEHGAIRDPRSIVEQVIRKLDNERIQAQIHADVAALERIYADDFIGVGPSGTVRTKPQVISDFSSGDLRFQSIGKSPLNESARRSCPWRPLCVTSASDANNRGVLSCRNERAGLQTSELSIRTA